MGMYKHTIEESNGKVTIQRVVDGGEMNKMILGIVVALAIMFTLLIALPDVTSGKKPLSDLVIALALIFIGGSIGGFIVKFLVIFALPFLSHKVIVDKNNQILSTSNGSLSVRFSDVEEILITEKAGGRFPINLITLKLKNGQFSLPFTFVSYNDAKIIQEKLREITMK